MQHCYNVFFTGSNVIAHNINIHSGGGINLFNSTVIFNGKCSVFNNSSRQHGGSIYVTVSGKTTLLAEIEKVGFLLPMDSINTRLCYGTSS